MVLKKMGLKSKEGDRTEKIIRSLLKLPENRRCINCNSLGPQYVCTTFWTFVCTNCSGIHREFTHRVKSVSMAKFSVDEVNALQAGGNEQARSIYFKTWNPLRNSYPDSSNMTRLRDFIKSVYVDRRYTGESPHNNNRFSRWSLSVREDSYGRRHSDFSGERYRYSERFDDRNDRCYIDERRSQSSIRENFKLGGSSSGAFPAAEPENRLHDSPILNRSATQMFTTADLLPERYSPRNAPDTPKNVGTHSPGRSQIFGDNFLNLQVRNQAKSGEGRENDGSVRAKGCGEASKANKTHYVDNGSLRVQKIGPPNNLTRKSEVDNTKKGSNSKSLIDAPTKHEAPNTLTVQTDLLMQDGDANSAHSEPPIEDKKDSIVPPKNTLEYLLFELGNTTNEPTSGDKSKPHITDKTAQTNSGSATLHATESGPVISPSNTETGSLDLVFPALPCTERTTSLRGNVATSSNDTSLGQNPASHHTYFSSANDEFLQPFNGGSSFGSENNEMTKSPSGGGQTMNCHGMPPALPVNCNSANGLSSCEREANLHTGPNYIDTSFGNSVAFDTTTEEQLSFLQQPQNTAVPSSILSDEASKSQLVSSSSSVGPLVQSSSGQAECANRRSASPALANSTTTTRKEIPADLFASLYTSGSAVIGCGWHNFPNYGTRFNMQHHNASAQGPVLSQAPRSRNPFDLSSETSQGHDATAGFPFPSLASLQGPLFNLPSPQGFSSYCSQPPAQGPHMEQQNFFNSYMVSPGLQGEGSFGSGRGGGMIGPFDPSRPQQQQQEGGYGNYSALAPARQSPYGGPSRGGNPFG